MKITFCGAAKIVTGSCYLMEVGRYKILVDCGMFQGSKKITRMNYEPFKFDAGRIDFVFLTHAHIDHSGLIPKLRKHGFRGKVFATSATCDLCKIMLEDSANIQVHETKHENRRRRRMGLPPREPLYTLKEVKEVFSMFRRVSYNRLYTISDGIQVVYKDAGHIIGSAIVELYLNDQGVNKKFVFSGDLGQLNAPIVKDPAVIDYADYLFIESTYGDRLHEKIQLRDDLLLKYVLDTYKRGGKLLIPSFAIERTQELLYTINLLIKQKKFPKDMKVFLDSPLAIKATKVFSKHRECFDEDALNLLREPFHFKNLVFTPNVKDSMKLNDYDKPCIIMAGSGMCTAGRIRHHIKHNIWDAKNTLLFVGYQAKGTLGRIILEGKKRIRFMGMEVVVKAKIGKINSFSAHGDYKDLVSWAKKFVKKPKKVFVVHGEEASAIALKQKLQEIGLSCKIPSLGERVEV